MLKNGWANTQFGLYGHMVDMVPTNWLMQINNPAPTEYTDLLDHETLVDLETLWENICTNGMRDPILIRVCLEEGLARIEAGNHRILMAHRKSEPYMPATVSLGRGLLSEGNGTHFFSVGNDLLVNGRGVPVFNWMCAPTNVFSSLWQIRESLPDPSTYRRF